MRISPENPIAYLHTIDTFSCLVFSFLIAIDAEHLHVLLHTALFHSLFHSLIPPSNYFCCHISVVLTAEDNSQWTQLMQYFQLGPEDVLVLLCLKFCLSVSLVNVDDHNARCLGVV